MKQERDTHNNYFVLSQDMVLISRGGDKKRRFHRNTFFGIDCLCLQHEPANGHKLVITIANYLTSNQRLVDTKPHAVHRWEKSDQIPWIFAVPWLKPVKIKVSDNQRKY